MIDERPQPLTVMHKIDDGRIIQESIFSLNATVLAPFLYLAEEEFQTLEKAFEIQKEFMRHWTPWAVTGGIGLFSLKRNQPAGLLARVDLQMRPASTREMQQDFQFFGEQVVSYVVGEDPQRDEEFKHNPQVKLWDKMFYYTGPPRLVKALIPTRVFKGEIPLSLEEIKSEVDNIALSPTGPKFPHEPEVAPQGYRFFWAKDGIVHQIGFAPDEYTPKDDEKDPRITSYNPKKVTENIFVKLEIDDGNLYTYVGGDRDKKSDHTLILDQYKLIRND
jgi:hypothetical protein